ncbi:hypothetical protein [Micromonospora sp. NBC_01638]|uniref:hypothetical protein n=1 Tax=Micromonospora sp. NBC_01638 TaxID=2975982 RepID=UPI00386E3322|nr:hypothetical protein OG811_20075 [Micromonospora sp. NBC_01638]
MTDTKAPTRARVGPLLRRAGEAEAATWRSLYVWARRRPLPLEPGDEPFGYLRGLRVRLSSGIDPWIPWTDIEALRKRYRSLPSSRSVQAEQEGDRRVVSIAVGSQTSIDVLLRRPLTFDLPKGGSAPTNELRLYADDPDGLLRSARGTPASHTVSR